MRTVRLGARSPVAGSVSHFLAMSVDGKTLFALVPAARGEPQSVVELAAATLEVERRHPLPAGIVLRGLELGPRSGRLYLLGNRGGLGAPVLVVLDPSDGAVLDRMTIRPARGRDWYVLDGAVSADEQYLAVSYHGEDTTGPTGSGSPSVPRHASIAPPATPRASSCTGKSRSAGTTSSRRPARGRWPSSRWTAARRAAGRRSCRATT